MSISTFFRKSNRFILDFVFPPYCVSCQTTDFWLCPDCLRQITLLKAPVCQRCGLPLRIPPHSANRECPHHPLAVIEGIRAAARFEDAPLRQAIHALKYNYHRALAAPLGEMLVAAYHRFQLNAEVIVPVPLHRRRQLTRGFNQSEALAQVLSHHLGLPMNKTSLQRIRPTQTQIDLTVTERQRNVKGAFACLDQELAGRTVLLVDDVCTTGATLDACAAALRQAHSGPVWALTLSRATIDPAPVDPT